MPKSYKITLPNFFEPEIFNHEVNLTKQMHLPETVPGPETKLRKSLDQLNVADFEGFLIDHEYTVNIQGRLYEDGALFNKFIAKSQIKAYRSQEKEVLLLCGKKADILDFCRQTRIMPQIKLSVIQIDMDALQEKLPEVRGVWFRSTAGYIRARAYMGNQIQDTPEYITAKNEGQISTLSFYFEDARSGRPHPILITEDGAVVLQGTYESTDQELDFVMYVKSQLLDGIYKVIDVKTAKESVSGLA